MKKYNKPSTEIIKIATRKMVATSVAISGTAVDADQSQSRGSNSVWDDDEE